ncbi:MAG TPA: hypothetical protein PKX92_08970 [Edaphocola sp.]|nr:hypothetical protein [Edaphocola sp.]
MLRVPLEWHTHSNNWAEQTYSFQLQNQSSINKITFDPNGLMADAKPENYVFEMKSKFSFQ